MDYVKFLLSHSPCRVLRTFCKVLHLQILKVETFQPLATYVLILQNKKGLKTIPLPSIVEYSSYWFLSTELWNHYLKFQSQNKYKLPAIKVQSLWKPRNWSDVHVALTRKKVTTKEDRSTDYKTDKRERLTDMQPRWFFAQTFETHLPSNGLAQRPCSHKLSTASNCSTSTQCQT